MKPVVAILIALSISAASPAFTLTAEAATCSPSSHCYGVAAWTYGPSNEGVYAYVDSTCLNGPNDSTNHASEELWEGTNNSPTLNYWVETGLAYGEMNGVPEGGPFWFWADNRPGGGYHEHYYAKAANNTQYLLEIVYAGSNQWFVYDNGVHTGTSTSNPPYSQSMETGEEFTSTSYNISGTLSDLSWFDTSGGNHATWSYNGNAAYITYNSPGYAAWITGETYAAIDYHANCGFPPALPMEGPTSAATPVRPGQIAAQPTTTLHAEASVIPTSVVRRLASLSRTIVQSAAVGTMVSARSVLTTRLQANAVASGAFVNSDQPVYLVELHGQFKGVQGSMPHGQQPPAGHYLTFTVDTDTAAVLDWGISDTASDLAALGPVSSLVQTT